MTKKEKAAYIVKTLEELYPETPVPLIHKDPYTLMIAVLLSAQCTDKRINQVTPALFKQFPSPKHLAAATFDEVFNLIRSVSYPNNKSKHFRIDIYLNIISTTIKMRIIIR